jgi:hypothetical protein
MRHPTGYACGECGAAATVDPDGTIRRSCAHQGTVTMLLDCELSGSGAAGDSNPLLEALRRAGSAIMRRVR